MGMALLASNKPEEAEKLFQRIESLDPHIDLDILKKEKRIAEHPGQEVTLSRLEYEGQEKTVRTSKQPSWASSLGLKIEEPQKGPAIPDWLSSASQPAVATPPAAPLPLPPGIFPPGLTKPRPRQINPVQGDRFSAHRPNRLRPPLRSRLREPRRANCRIGFKPRRCPPNNLPWRDLPVRCRIGFPRLRRLPAARDVTTADNRKHAPGLD